MYPARPHGPEEPFPNRKVNCLPSDGKCWAPVSEPGLLRFSKNISKIGIPGEFLKTVSKNGSAQYRRIIIGRLQHNWFPIRRPMEAKNRP